MKLIQMCSVIALGGFCTVAMADTVTQVSDYAWKTRTVVGLSGLEVSADGERFEAVGDQGWYVTGSFERDSGAISGIIVDRYDALIGIDGLPMAGRRMGDWSDAEGLAIDPAGQRWISFERWARVSQFDAVTAAEQTTKNHPTFGSYAQNRQLEAVAAHPDGTIYAFAEKPLADGFPVYTWDGTAWAISGHIRDRNRFAIVGADFDASGTLYLLERKLVVGLWWQNRLRRVDVTKPAQDEVLWTSKAGAFYNLEGVAVWRDANGLRVTMVSDNNSESHEVTQFLELRLTD